MVIEMSVMMATQMLLSLVLGGIAGSTEVMIPGSLVGLFAMLLPIVPAEWHLTGCLLGLPCSPQFQGSLAGQSTGKRCWATRHRRLLGSVRFIRGPRRVDSLLRSARIHLSAPKGS